jgi:hypothetical protein
MVDMICETRPRARHRHQCGLCYEAIEVGDRYVRQFNRDGGEVWTWKAHLKCDALASVWITVFGDPYTNGVDEGSHGQIVADLCDHFDCEPEAIPIEGTG